MYKFEVQHISDNIWRSTILYRLALSQNLARILFRDKKVKIMFYNIFYQDKIIVLSIDNKIYVLHYQDILFIRAN